MLYTGKGDGGDTGLFGTKERFPKNAAIIEALGTLDELNSWLGVCRSGADKETNETLESVQQNLFIIQAELAGSPEKNIRPEKVEELNKKINEIEAQLPPIKSFFLPGGSVLGAQLDYARTVARRAERRAVSQNLAASSRAYLNRLSSLLYALARLANHKSGIKEEPPHY